MDATLHTCRTLPFTPDQVWGAFAAADELARWWGPDGFTNTFEIFDFQPGGRWVFVMHGPDGRDYANENLFVALDPGRRAVIQHVCAPHFTLTVTLQAVDGGTLVDWQQTFDDAKTAQAVQAIVGPANEQNLDRMTRVLASRTGRAA